MQLLVSSSLPLFRSLFLDDNEPINLLQKSDNIVDLFVLYIQSKVTVLSLLCTLKVHAAVNTEKRGLDMFSRTDVPPDHIYVCVQ